MIKLVYSEFSRLFRSKIFYIALTVSILIPIISYIDSYRYYLMAFKDLGVSLSFSFEIDYYLSMNLMIYDGFVSSSFISLFVGKENSNGTIRNKIIVGHTRSEVYLSYFVVCLVAGIIIQASNIAVISVFSLVLKAVFKTPISLQTPLISVVKTQAIGLFITAAYTALFLAVSVLISSKARAVAAAMITAIVIFIVGEAVCEKVVLTYDAVDIMIEESESDTEGSKNGFSYENYQKVLEELRGDGLSGSERTVFLFLDDFLPYCQVSHFLAEYPELPVRSLRYFFYDVGITAGITYAGIFMFRRKDLK